MRTAYRIIAASAEPGALGLNCFVPSDVEGHDGGMLPVAWDWLLPHPHDTRRMAEIRAMVTGVIVAMGPAAIVTATGTG